MELVDNKYKGISWSSKHQRFKAVIRINNVMVLVGMYLEKGLAIKARDRYIISHGLDRNIYKLQKLKPLNKDRNETNKIPENIN